MFVVNSKYVPIFSIFFLYILYMGYGENRGALAAAGCRRLPPAGRPPQMEDEDYVVAAAAGGHTAVNPRPPCRFPPPLPPPFPPPSPPPEVLPPAPPDHAPPLEPPKDTPWPPPRGSPGVPPGSPGNLQVPHAGGIGGKENWTTSTEFGVEVSYSTSGLTSTAVRLRNPVSLHECPRR